jgi:hypothetical protein
VMLGLPKEVTREVVLWLSPFLGIPQHHLLAGAANGNITKAIEVGENSLHGPNIRKCPMSACKE